MRSALRSVLPLLALVAGLIALTGCSHYQLGTGSSPSFRTLYIAPVGNTAGMPQAVAIVTTQLRETFARDGRVTLAASADEADTVLEIDLVSYQRGVLTSLPGDTGLARKFEIVLLANATLRDQRNDQPLFENRRLRVERQIFTDSGQLQAEYQIVPLLAETLAQNARSAVLDTW